MTALLEAVATAATARPRLSGAPWAGLPQQLTRSQEPKVEVPALRIAPLGGLEQPVSTLGARILAQFSLKAAEVLVPHGRSSGCDVRPG